jgi:hypothetical protein
MLEEMLLRSLSLRVAANVPLTGGRTRDEEPHRNANYAYLCATRCLSVFCDDQCASFRHCALAGTVWQS